MKKRNSCGFERLRLTTHMSPRHDMIRSTHLQRKMTYFGISGMLLDRHGQPGWTTDDVSQFPFSLFWKSLVPGNDIVTRLQKNRHLSNAFCLLTWFTTPAFLYEQDQYRPWFQLLQLWGRLQFITRTTLRLPQRGDSHPPVHTLYQNTISFGVLRSCLPVLVAPGEGHYLTHFLNFLFTDKGNPMSPPEAG